MGPYPLWKGNAQNVDKCDLPSITRNLERVDGLLMKLESPIRLGGLAALLAGVLLLISQLLGALPLGFLPFKLSGRELAIYGWGGIDTYLGILLMMLVQLGLVGLYARQARATRILGVTGYFVAFLGGRLALAPSFIDPVSEPSTWALAG